MNLQLEWAEAFFFAAPEWGLLLQQIETSHLFSFAFLT